MAVARKGQVAVLRKNTWDIQAQWPVTEHLSGLGLSADGMAVAFLTYDRAACSLHIRWLSSPKVPETNRSTDRHCLEFGSVAFLPLPSNARQIAVPFSDNPADFGFQIWDLQESRMIREYEFKVPPPTPPVFWQVSYSPGLKYAFLTLNSPDYSQDVLAFDAESGQPVYEGEKSAGRISPCMPADIVHPWPGYEPTLELSEDGRFLLTTLGETYKVFELIR